MITVSSISNTFQTYFTKQLLEHAVHDLRLNEFAQQRDLPRNVGSKVIRFWRRERAASGNVQTLTEGTPISTFRDFVYTPIDATLVQIGQAMKITDIVEMTSLFDTMKDGTALMGEECALDADDRTRNVLAHQTTGLSKRYAQGLANFNAVVAASVSASKLTGVDLLDGATKLKTKTNRAPKINGGYVAVTPPEGARDLMRDTDWLDAAKYSNVQALYKGEVGRIHGVRVVEATNPFTEAATNDTEGTFVDAGPIYTTMLLGRGAFGVPKLAGTQSPWKPRVIMNVKPDKSDPLNQFVTAGWKAFWIPVLLNATFGLAIRHKTAFVA